MRKITIVMILTLLTMGNTVFAGGYQVGLHGQKQIGMGLVGTSLIFDASCMFYNPGGLSFIQAKNSFAFGMSPIISKVVFQKESPSLYQSKTDSPLGTPLYFYGATRIGERWGVGLALNTPYGNSLKWEEGWDGRFLIEDIAMKAFFIQPTVSFKVNDYLGIGAGLVFVHGKVDLNKSLPITGQTMNGHVNIKGSTIAWGFNAGLMIRPTEKLNIGIDYRSEVSMSVDDADATFIAPESLVTQFPPENKVATELPLPANLDFGLSYEFSEKFMLALSLNYVFWETYESLDFDFKTNTDALQDTENPRNYHNRLIARLGGQYKPVENLTVRLGTYYDPSPVDEEFFSPETPSLNNLAFTAGISYEFAENMSLDASFLYIMGMERDVTYSPDNFGGTYKSSIYIPGIGLTIGF